MNFKVFETFGKYGGIAGLILLAIVLIVWVLVWRGVIAKFSKNQSFTLVVLTLVGLFGTFCYYEYMLSKAFIANRHYGSYKFVLSGHVEDADEHISLSDVNIGVNNEHFQTTTDGNFQMTFLSKDSPTRVTVRLLKFGYESLSRVLDLPMPSLELELHKSNK